VEAVAAVLQTEPPKATTGGNEISGFKVVSSESHQIVYGIDGDGRCFVVITGNDYPNRVAMKLLTDFHKDFVAKFGLMAMSATANSLTKKSTPLMKELCQKYQDLTKVDNAAAVMAKVEAVKITMQDNIATMLANTEKAEDLQSTSESLNEQAAVFKKKGTELKKQMWCKNVKTTAILVLLVVGVLAVILVPLFTKSD